MSINNKQLEKFSKKLFAHDEFNQQRFYELIHQPDPIENQALVWLKDKPSDLPFQIEQSNFFEFVDLVSVEDNPGKTNLHEQGFFYCLDYSSVFSASIIRAIHPSPKFIIDLCASPGGKSIMAYRYFDPEILVCNEVISKRLKPLISNLKRCDIKSYVSSLNLSRLPSVLKTTAPLVLIDAPCSGQSLILKEKSNPGCFNPMVIKNNFKRQKSILKNADQLISSGGFLAYMTCTFSFEENEGVIDWFLKKYPNYQPVKLNHLEKYQSDFVNYPAYRIWPWDKVGAGGFAVLLQKEGELDNEIELYHYLKNLPWVWKNDL